MLYVVPSKATVLLGTSAMAVLMGGSLARTRQGTEARRSGDFSAHGTIFGSPSEVRKGGALRVVTRAKHGAAPTGIREELTDFPGGLQSCRMLQPSTVPVLPKPRI